MFFLAKIINFSFYTKNTAANQNIYINIFKDAFLKYNIMYDKLEDFKSGALCIPEDNNASLSNYAIGFSHNVYKKINFSKDSD